MSHVIQLENRARFHHTVDEFVAKRGDNLIKVPLSLTSYALCIIYDLGRVCLDMSKLELKQTTIHRLHDDCQGLLAAPYGFLLKTFNPYSQFDPLSQMIAIKETIFSWIPEIFLSIDQAIYQSDDFLSQQILGRLFVLFSLVMKLLFSSICTILMLLFIVLSLLCYGKLDILNYLTQTVCGYAGLSVYYVIQALIRLINLTYQNPKDWD
jgi:hypothetical protein